MSTPTFLKVPVPEYYIHGKDRRSPEETERQSSTIRNLCSLNEMLFKNLTEKEYSKKVVQFRNEVLEMKLSEGRYLYYTDRTNYIQEDSTSYKPNDLPIIMTIHGNPGSMDDFLNLQQHTQSRISCRWINFTVPGLDKKDERRGKFLGYIEDVVLLIKDFLDELKIDKIILVMHSLGGLFGKNFVYSHPTRVRATVQLATIGLEMWGPLLYQNEFFSRYDIDVNNITKEEIETTQFREKLAQAIQTEKEAKKGKADKSLLIWLNKTLPQHIMLLKAQVCKEGYDSVFLKMKNLDKRIPRFFAYSTCDVLLQEYHLQQEVYHNVLSPESLKFKLKSSSNDFDQVFALRDKEHVLRNFIFSYSDSGHSFQHHKGFDISIRLIVFIKLLDFITPQSPSKDIPDFQLRPSL